MFVGKKCIDDTSKIVAGVLSNANMMFFDIASHMFSMTELETSIIHELIHLKYPDDTENDIIKKTRKIKKRYNI